MFAVGAIGSMTLAIMTRATLGHTGRALKADLVTCVIFAAILIAAPVRLMAVFLPETAWLLHLSATLWIPAFLGFVLRYRAMLVSPRLG